MAETYKVVNQIPSLVTSAHFLEDAREIKAVPSSWIFSKHESEKVQLFETSTDSSIKAANTSLQNNPEFFDEIGKLLRDHDLTELLSLAVLKRESLVGSEGQLYVELNDESDKESVVQLWNTKDSPKESIRTSWSFKGLKQHECPLKIVCFWDHYNKRHPWDYRHVSY
jgi:hypothetical protein